MQNCYEFNFFTMSLVHLAVCYHVFLRRLNFVYLLCFNFTEYPPQFLSNNATSFYLQFIRVAFCRINDVKIQLFYPCSPSKKCPESTNYKIHTTISDTCCSIRNITPKLPDSKLYCITSSINYN